MSVFKKLPIELFVSNLKNKDLRQKNCLVDASTARSWSYLDIGEAAEDIAHYLLSLKVVPGDKVIIFVRGEINLLVAFFGAAIAGAVPILINVSIHYDHLIHAQKYFGARLVISNQDCLWDIKRNDATHLLKEMTRKFPALMFSAMLDYAESIRPRQEAIIKDNDQMQQSKFQTYNLKRWCIDFYTPEKSPIKTTRGFGDTFLILNGIVSRTSEGSKEESHYAFETNNSFLEKMTQSVWKRNLTENTRALILSSLEFTEGLYGFFAVTLAGGTSILLTTNEDNATATKKWQTNALF